MDFRSVRRRQLGIRRICKLAITIESLKTVSLPQDRTLGRWRSSQPDAIVGWEKLANVDQYDKCLIEGKMMDTIEGDYAGIEAAKESDFFVPFVHLMWQGQLLWLALLGQVIYKKARISGRSDLAAFSRRYHR